MQLSGVPRCSSCIVGKSQIVPHDDLICETFCKNGIVVLGCAEACEAIGTEDSSEETSIENVETTQNVTTTVATTTTTKTTTTTTEEPTTTPDFEKYCVEVLCIIGEGGTLCNCDKLPLF